MCVCVWVPIVIAAMFDKRVKWKSSEFPAENTERKSRVLVDGVDERRRMVGWGVVFCHKRSLLWVRKNGHGSAKRGTLWRVHYNRKWRQHVCLIALMFLCLGVCGLFSGEHGNLKWYEPNHNQKLFVDFQYTCPFYNLFLFSVICLYCAPHVNLNYFITSLYLFIYSRFKSNAKTKQIK